MTKSARSARTDPSGSAESSDPRLEKLVGTERPLDRRRVYAVLAAIALLAFIASITLRRIDWVDRFASNLGTEVLGILLTLIFVHRFLEQQDRARRLRSSIGALRKGSRALLRIIEAWEALIRGGMRKQSAQAPASLRELFAPHVTESLSLCDPAVSRPERDPTGLRWVQWCAAEMRAAQQQLSEIIVTYGAALEPAYVEALDDLVDDPFLAFFAHAVHEPPDARTWRVALNTARALREAHFERLLETIALHNAIAREAATVRGRRSRPRSGSLGVELSPDYDLRVETGKDAARWNRPPAPGSLCSER